MPPRRPQAATQGPIDAEALGAAVAATLPEHAIVVDESVTFAAPILAATAAAPAHDWLTVTGGSIGFGLPTATGAAVACPGRPVLCLDGDGSAMYTIQSLWTQARESLDVTNVIVANRSYAILDFEMERVGASGGGAPPASCSTSAAPSWTSSASPRAWACRHGASRTPPRSPRRCASRSRSPARGLSKR